MARVLHLLVVVVFKGGKMAFPKRRGRLTEAQRRSEWQRSTAKLSDLPQEFPADSPSIAEWLKEPPLPPKAHLIRRTSDEKPALPLEKHVLAAALRALHKDPRVALVERTQSGVFQDGNRYIRVGTPGKLDVTGMLVGGRYFEMEAKRPGQKPDERQALRISTIRANGGISGYFTSADEALALLP
jgi:hypothetical protein